MKRPNLAKIQRQCDIWNAANFIGCNVQLTKDSGEVIATTTRSEAQVLSGHSAVIWLEGVSGCYLLDRVKRLPIVLDVQGEQHTMSHS